MIDITLQNFESELLQSSLQQPVLLDIWAPWCGPCRTLGPLLEKLEAAYAGRFRLAKLNSDEQPEIAGQLSQAFGVRSIPFCVLFDRGQPVDGFVGAIPESEIRAFLDRHVPSADELAAEAEAEEAGELEAEGDADAALAKLQEAVAIDPANETARFDYVRLLIETSRTRPELLAQARLAYEPVAHRVVPHPRLDALGLWLDACEAAAAPTMRDDAALEAAIAANKRDFDARYELAQKHFAGMRFTQAMDELLEILMRDKAWKDGLARRTYVAILELMTRPAPKAAEGPATAGTLEITGKAAVASADPVVDQYRRRLSMVLF